MKFFQLVSATALALSSVPGLAQTPAPRYATATVSLPKAIATQHVSTFNGKKVRYDARIEPFRATDPNGKATANLAAISYVARDGAPDRPVIFVFNGGPLSASYILHAGALGPKRVAVPEDLSAPPSAFELADNPDTVLDVADLVFFDPAGTGFSRFAPGVDPNSQFGNKPDSRQLVSLVLEWTKAHGRTGAPIYLLGESYGTIRAPEAAQQLKAQGVHVAGLILLGQAVNIIEYSQRRGNIISYAVSLPTLAAIAWAHDKAERKGRSFDQFVADARTFAADRYLPVLFKGDTASAAEQREVADRLQEFTGLSAEWYLKQRLRVTKIEYQRLLLPGRRLATNDARYVGPAEAGDPFEAIPARYAELFKAYLASDLKAAGVGEYLVESPFTGGLNGWDWGVNKSPFGDWPYGATITEMFAANPNFRLLVGNGWTDTQTTVGAMEYLAAQAAWPRDRLRLATYEGGHMAYTIPASNKAFTGDVRAMVERKW